MLIRLFALGVVGFVALIGCGKVTSSDMHGGAGESDEVGCLPGSCGEGRHCYGSTACDAVWECREGYLPCSAAAPFMVCGCDGRFTQVAAGCPERHAWPAPITMEYVGDVCDVETPLSSADLRPLDLVYQGRNLHEFEGMTVRVRVLAPQATPERDVEVSALIRGGAFDFAWSGIGERLHSYFSVLTLIDLDADGSCGAGEPILLPRIPNPFELDASTASFALTPERFDEFSSHCDWWNE